VNLELSAEEWKRRYEREKDRADRLQALVQKLQEELNRWRSGEAVPQKEWTSYKLEDVKVSDSKPTQPSTTSNTSVLGQVDASTSLGPPPSTTHSKSSTTRYSPSRTDKSTTPTAPLPTMPRPSNDAPSSWEEERQKLYEALDEKDEEVANCSQIVERLTLQVTDLEETMGELTEENNLLRNRNSMLAQDVEAVQEEMKEVMQALEELAMSYDSKDKEIDLAYNERDQVKLELETLKLNMSKASYELDHLRDSEQVTRQTSSGAITALWQELRELGSTLQLPSVDGFPQYDPTTGDVTPLRVVIAELRNTAQAIAAEQTSLRTSKEEAAQHSETVTKELTNCKLQVTHYKEQGEMLAANLEEAETKRKELEKLVEGLSRHVSKLKKRLSESQGGDRASLSPSPDYIQGVFPEVHRKQLSALETDVNNRDALIQQLKEECRLKNEECQDMQSEMELVKKEFRTQLESLLSAKLKLEAMEMTKKDIGGFLVSVEDHMKNLDNTRSKVVDELLSRMMGDPQSGRTAPRTPGDGGLFRSEKERVRLLEENLDKLSYKYRQMASAHSQLQRSIPSLMARLEVKAKRINDLEDLVKASKEAQKKDYEKYQSDIEKLKNSYTRKLKDIKSQGLLLRGGPTIVKPVVRPARKEGTPGASKTSLLKMGGINLVGAQK
jgi:kinesin family protein 5